MTEIYNILIATIPSIVSVITIIASCAPIFKRFKELRDEVKSHKEYEELKRQLTICQQENAALQNKINELIVEITRVVKK